MGSWKIQFAGVPMLVAMFLAISNSSHASTAASSSIENVAAAVWNDRLRFESEADVFLVDELSTATLVLNDDAPIPVASPSQQLLSYTLTHTGNGSEAYLLNFTNHDVDQFDVTDVRLWLDIDNDGQFSQDVDQAYDPGNPPEFTPEQSLTVFVQLKVPANLEIDALAETTLSATAVSAGDNAGIQNAYLPDAGDNGVGLFFGPDGGVVTAAVGLQVNNNASIELLKEQEIIDPRGGSEPVPGAVITYRLILNFTGVGQLDSININDVIPEHTHYSPNSLKVNNQLMTDGNDADAAYYDANAQQVLFNFDGVAAPHDSIVLEFDVTIQ